MQTVIDYLHQLLDLVEQHGLSVVLLLGSIFAWVMLFRWGKTKFDEIWKEFLRMKKALPDQRNDNVEDIVKLNIEIKSLLKEALMQTHAGWVQLWQFHNGTYGIGRGHIPFMYISLTNEACRAELVEMRPQFKELPLSMFDFFANQLITLDLVIHNKEMTLPDGSKSGMSKVMLEHGAHASMMRAIRDEDGKIIGFMSFIYTENKDFKDECRNLARNYTQQMTALLASFSAEAEGR